jgi:hypothetical protein
MRTSVGFLRQSCRQGSLRSEASTTKRAAPQLIMGLQTVLPIFLRAKLVRVAISWNDRFTPDRPSKYVNPAIRYS